MRRVVVIGCGGTGSWLAHGLLKMLDFSDPGSMLILCDGDNYEPRNRERQLFTQLGNKAEVLAEELDKLSLQTSVVPQPRWVTATVDNVETKIAAGDLLQEDDVVFVMVDNNAARKLVFEAAGQYDNIDVFTGGNDEEYFGSTYLYRRRDGKDITDPPELWHPELIAPTDRNPADLSCHEKMQLEGGTQLLATNMGVAAQLLAQCHYNIICDRPLGATEVMFEMHLGLSQGYDRQVDTLNGGLVTIPVMEGIH